MSKVNKTELLTNYLSTLKVDVHTIEYGKCAPNWSDINYTPDYSKFYFICSGEGWLKIGDMEYYPTSGQLYIMPEGVKQSYSYISKEPFVKYWCHFNAKIGDINLFKMINFKYFIDVSNKMFYENFFKEMITIYKSKQINSKLLIKLKLMELISCFIMELGIDNMEFNNTVQMDNLNCILNYIDTHLYDELTIEKLSKVIYMHPNYFIRFFKKNMGITPIQYLTNKRINKSKEMLLSSNHTINEISEIVGFHDSSYFFKSFKRNVGLTPTEYRRNQTVITSHSNTNL